MASYFLAAELPREEIGLDFHPPELANSLRMFLCLLAELLQPTMKFLT